jgi:hypothetical protein
VQPTPVIVISKRICYRPNWSLIKQSNSSNCREPPHRVLLFLCIDCRRAYFPRSSFLFFLFFIFLQSWYIQPICGIFCFIVGRTRLRFLCYNFITDSLLCCARSEMFALWLFRLNGCTNVHDTVFATASVCCALWIRNDIAGEHMRFALAFMKWHTRSLCGPG